MTAQPQRPRHIVPLGPIYVPAASAQLSGLLLLLRHFRHLVEEVAVVGRPVDNSRGVSAM